MTELSDAEVFGTGTSSKSGEMSDADVFGSGTAKTQEPTPTWGQVLPLAAKHALPSVAEEATGIAKGVGGWLGAVSENAKYGPAAAPVTIAKAIYNNPSIVKDMPEAIWNDLVDHYGSIDALKRTMAYQPARFAMDAATLASGIGEGIGAARGAISDIGRAADVSKPFFERMDSHLPPPVPTPTTPPPLPGPELPRALITTNPVVKGGAVMLSRLPVVGAPLMKSLEGVQTKWGANVGDIAGQAAPVRTVGEQIGETLGGRAESEAAREAAQAGEATTYAERQAEAANTATERAHAERVQAQKDAYETAKQAQDDAYKVAVEESQRAHAADIEAQQQAIRDRLTQSQEGIRQRFGDVAPDTMSQNAIDAVRAAHEAGEEVNTAAWDKVKNTNAGMRTDAFHDIHQAAEADLRAAGQTVDNPGSNAGKMLDELERLTGRPAEPTAIPEGVKPRVLDALRKTYGDNIPDTAWRSVGVEPPPPAREAVPPDFRLAGRYAPAPGATAVPIQTVEQIRRRIGQMAMEAPRGDAPGAPADRAASNTIRGAVDRWFEEKAATHLTPGSDPNALQTIREARAVTHAHKTRFGYNERALPAGERRAAARVVNDIVTGDIGREKLASELVGDKPHGSPVYAAIRDAVDNPDQFRNELRGAYARTMFPEGRSARAVAEDVRRFPTTRMGGQLLNAGDVGVLRAHSDLVSQTPDALKAAKATPRPDVERPAPIPRPAPIEKPELLKAPKAVKIEPGEAQQLDKLVAGEKGGEDVFDKFDRMLLKTGDQARAEKVWNVLPQRVQDAFRSTWLRNMGHDGENFSSAKFSTAWNNYSEEAKRMIVPDREHRQALDTVAKQADQYKRDLAKFGNPPGTGPYNAWVKLIGAVGTAGGALLLGHPLPAITLIGGGIGLWKVSRMLGTPAGAQQVARFGKMIDVYRAAPSPAKLVLLQNAARSIQRAADAIPVQSTHPAAAKAAENDQSLFERILGGVSSRLTRESELHPPPLTGPVRGVGIRG